ncbi:MAG: sigma-70 family RNA polymerase sigma factor [Phycisphaerales bacterium]|nr:MAG: sigma-70 family RNA polymerase sigma factor [Phycisphaerales bacterium]
MVATKIEANACDFQIDPLTLKCASSPKVRGRKAKGEAVEVADLLVQGDDAAGEVSEVALFEALHVCAYQAARQPNSKRISPAERMTWARRWKLVRDELVERNLGLVYTMLAEFRLRGLDYDDLRSEAMYALVRAVEGFDPWRGFRLSTYACNAIVRSLIQLARKTNTYRLRFPVEHEDWQEPLEKSDSQNELRDDRLHRVLKGNLCGLTHREAAVIGWRFPLDGRLGLTLGEVGEAIGLSKERVRQIQKSALTKLRGVLETDPVMQ